MSALLPKSDIIREGFAKKSAAAKGKDEVRPSWQERWFILRKGRLDYYKQKADSTPKGTIDLRDAKIEVVDESTTGKPFCLRIAQAKQVFVYFQCSNELDKTAWLKALREQTGGYSIDELKEIDTKRDFSDRVDALTSFGVLQVNDGDENAEKVLVAIARDGVIRFIKEEICYKAYPALELTNVSVSTKPEFRLVDVSGVHDLYSLVFDFRLQNRHKFFMGSVEESKFFLKIAQPLVRNDISQVRKPPVVAHQGVAELGTIGMSSDWRRRFLVLTEKRLIIYKDSLSVMPLFALFLNSNCVRRDGKLGLSIKTGVETAILKFDTEQIRDEWQMRIEALSLSLKEKIEAEVTPSPPTSGSYPDASKDNSAAEKLPPQPLIVAVPAAAPLNPGDNSFLISFGCGAQGQLGNRAKDDSLTPVVVDALTSKKVRAIAAGETHAGAVTEQGHVYMWGKGEELQLGLGDNMKESKAPYLVTSLIRNAHIIMLACGRAHTLAMSTTGAVFSWGCGSSGQLGFGPAKLNNASYPSQIKSLEAFQARFVAAGGDHSAAIIGENWELFTWGSNTRGQLGIGNNKLSADPLPNILNKKGKVVYVSCGSEFTASILSTGRLYTWGANDCGQLGLGDKNDRLVPSEVQYLTQQEARALYVATGAQHSVVLSAKGDGAGIVDLSLKTKGGRSQTVVYTFGAGVLNGFREAQVWPTRVSALEATRFVAAHRSHSITINDDLQMFAFGVNRYGELGNGQANVQALVKVRLNAECRVVSSACGNGFTLALVRGDQPENILPGAKRGAPVLNQGQLNRQIKENQTEEMKLALGMQGDDSALSTEDAAVKIARLLQLEADAEHQAGLAPRTVVEPGKIEILAHSTLGLKGTGTDYSPAAPEVRTVGGPQQQPLPPTPAPVAVAVPIPAAPVRPYSGGGSGGYGDAESVQPSAHFRPSVLAAAQVGANLLSQQQNSVAALIASRNAAAANSSAAPPMPMQSGSADEDDVESLQSMAASIASNAGGDANLGDESGDSKKKKEPLPPGWRKVKDEKSGRTYYYHLDTKKTQWKRPKPGDA